MSTFTRLCAVFLALFLWQANAHADLDSIKKAAEGGDAERQLELGILYEYGFNFKGNNQVPALTWYMLSADQGVAKAARLRDALQAKLTPTQVQEAREEAEKLKATMTFKPAPVVEPKPEAQQPASTTVPTEEQPTDAEPKPAATPAAAAKKPAATPETTPSTTPPLASPATATPASPRTATPAQAPVAEQPK